MYDDITGIILSGGKSSRMGKNKSLLKIGEQTIIERVSDLMKSLFTKVILITNTPNDYGFLKLPIYEDVYKHKGPLAGIHSGLLNSLTENNFIISCDLPFISPELIKFLIDYKTDKLITVGKANGIIQPLAGRYSKLCLEFAERLLEEKLTNKLNTQIREKNGARVFSLFEKIDIELVKVDGQPFYKDDLYFNMNSMEDYVMMLKKLTE